MAMSIKLKAKPKGKTRSQVKSIDHKAYGDEPIIEGTPTESQLTEAFNFYNYMHDISQAKKWVLEYLKRAKRSPQMISEIRSAPDWKTSTTAGWMARMMMNGTVFNEAYMARFEDRLRLNALAGIKDEPVEVVKTNVISIQDRVKKNIQNLIAEVEEELDKNAEFSLYDFLTGKQASVQAANAVREYYIKAHDEVFSGDDQVKEAYGKTLKFWQKVYDNMITDLDRYTNNKKVVKIRKPREKKVKSAVDQVKNLKYQKEFPQLKIVSVNPAEIVGAQQLWVYNTKYRKITQYVTQSPQGLQIKGTTLTGWDVEKSLTKSVRKPDAVLSELLKAGKVAIRTFMSDLKTNETKPNGRINEDTILLRVIK